MRGSIWCQHGFWKTGKQDASSAREKQNQGSGDLLLRDGQGWGACQQPIISTKAMPGTHRIPVTLSCPVAWHAGRSSCPPSQQRIACWNWRLDHLSWGRDGINWCPGPFTSPYVAKTLWRAASCGESQPYPRGSLRNSFKVFPLVDAKCLTLSDHTSLKKLRGVRSRS